MGNLTANTYQQASARGASPVGLIVSLYDTILRDLRRALAAHQAGNIETRVFELNHALTVIAHLQSILDRERSPEAAGRFHRFYEVTRALLLEASVAPSSHAFQKLLDLYTPVRQAWQQLDQTSPTSTTSPLPASTDKNPPQSVPVAPSMEHPRGSWSA